MKETIRTAVRGSSEVAQDIAREAAWRAGYDDYMQGSMDHYPDHILQTAAYERGAAQAVFDAQEARVAFGAEFDRAMDLSVQELVIARATTGRGYQARHLRAVR